ELVALGVKRQPIGRRAPRRVRVAEGFLDLCDVTVQRAEDGLRVFAKRNGARLAHTGASTARSPEIEFCVDAVMRTSTMSPFCAVEPVKCTDWRYGERPCFCPGLRPSPVTSTGSVRPTWAALNADCCANSRA